MSGLNVGRKGGEGAPEPHAGKRKGAIQIWLRLIRYMGRYKFLLIASMILAVLGTVLMLLSPDYISQIVDIIRDGLVVGDMDLEGIKPIALTLIAIYAATVTMSLIQGLITASIAHWTAMRLRDDIAKKIERMPLSYLDGLKSGDILSRITNDTDSIGTTVNRSVNLIITAIVQLIGSLVMMLITNVMLAAVAVVSAVCGFLLTFVVVYRSQRYFARQQASLGSMNAHIAETYVNHATVVSYNGNRLAREEFDRINADLRHSSFMAYLLGDLPVPLMIFMNNIGYVMVCLVGSILVIEGEITIGTIVAFMLYIKMFANPLQQLSQLFSAMQSAAAAAGRVYEFLDGPECEDESGKTRTIAAKGHVEFRDVHFSYVEGKEILHGFSAEVLPGQKVAIVGPTGAGKTTMVNLLMRFYEVDSGDILIDGVPVKELTRENVRDQFCMVLQDAWMFEGTIRENLAFNREDVTDDDLEVVCRAVGLHHFITTLPDGYDTVLKDSDSLSAGQRQQLAIARAMLDLSPMLILDEATSSVDTRTELIIQQAMDDLSRGRTSFVIAHRLSTIRNADMIFVMWEGNIIEHGTHEELLAKGGFYYELYNSQFASV